VLDPEKDKVEQTIEEFESLEFRSVCGWAMISSGGKFFRHF
jgi:hypothetical protein